MRMNTVSMIGNLTRDPELRTTPSGKKVCTFTLAVQRRGEREAADFIPVVCWEKLAESCGNHLQKGARAGVCGRIQTRSYDAADGSRRTSMEVVAWEVEFLSRRPEPQTAQPLKFGELAEDTALPF